MLIFFLSSIFPMCSWNTTLDIVLLYRNKIKDMFCVDCYYRLWIYRFMAIVILNLRLHSGSATDDFFLFLLWLCVTKIYCQLTNTRLKEKGLSQAVNSPLNQHYMPWPSQRNPVHQRWLDPSFRMYLPLKVSVLTFDFKEVYYHTVIVWKCLL